MRRNGTQIGQRSELSTVFSNAIFSSFREIEKRYSKNYYAMVEDCVYTFQVIRFRIFFLGSRFITNCILSYDYAIMKSLP